MVLKLRELTVGFSVHDDCRLSGTVSAASSENIVGLAFSGQRSIGGEGCRLGSKSTSRGQHGRKTKKPHGEKDDVNRDV